jgi:hypothetical protein
LADLGLHSLLASERIPCPTHAIRQNGNDWRNGRSRIARVVAVAGIAVRASLPGRACLLLVLLLPARCRGAPLPWRMVSSRRHHNYRTVLSGFPVHMAGV